MADTESQHTYPEPTPWWRRPAEMAVTMALLIVVGMPVALVTRNPLLAAVVSIVVVLGLNAVYWKLLRGTNLSEVYDALKPWV